MEQSIVTLPDLIRAAYGNTAFEALSKQYGLPPGAVETAMAAMSPGFADAFRGMSLSPIGMKAFFELLAAHPVTNFYDQMAANIPPEAQEKGREILTKVMGSERVQKALAEHAAAQVGVNQAVLLEMMPLIANAVMDQMAKQVAANPFVAAWTNAFTPTAAEAPRPQPPPAAAPDTTTPSLGPVYEAGEAQMKAMAEMIDRMWSRG
jgi:hypothetical protein